MNYEFRRKNRETSEVKENIFDRDRVVLDTKSMRELIDSLPKDVDEEIYNAAQEVANKSASTHDMDLEWIREHEVSEGKIDLNSNSKVDKEEPIEISNDQQDKIESTEVENVNNAPLDFVEYARSLMEKYHANDYHRMMDKGEYKNYVNLYSKAYNIDPRDAKKLVEDSIDKQLSRELSEPELRKQGLEQQKLMIMTNDYMSKYGNNFMAYLNDQDLEKYSNQYLHSYNVRRSTVDKMYDTSLENAFASITGPSEPVVESSKTMGFSAFKLLLLTTFMFLSSIAFIALYFYLGNG